MTLIDEIGDWSQIKHDILEKYAHAYTTIVKKQALIKKVLYFDAYAGSGYAVDRESQQQLRGSALRALNVTPPFDELHFVEQSEDKASILESATRGDQRVTVHRGDGVAITQQLLSKARFRDYHRALCLLDPYDLSVPWSLVKQIGGMGSIEIFYNFMIMDANMNVLWKQLDQVPEDRRPRMDLIWGDRSWTDECYEVELNLFGETKKKLPNEEVAEAFRRRLRDVAGFKYVPAPIAMKNSMNATVYYLYFASPNKTGADIVEKIFSKYRT